jgi:SpoVK/Ycf46/Vps4 family AAA+-type ATPase
MASTYAGLLADKLERDGERKQARLVREHLARAPQALAMAQDGSRGVFMGALPVDGESRLSTIDVSHPVLSDGELILPSALRTRLAEFLESVRRHDELAAAGAAQPSRLLVYGPPGTGKTRLARNVAAELHLPLYTVRCDTLVSSLLGQTSRNLRRVFDYSQQAPCVLFLDEFDALASARGNERDVGELQRVVISLLQNMDALPESTILVAATNHDELLDRAVWRRFGYLIPMPLPDIAARQALWKQFLGSYAPADCDWREIASRSEGTSGALIEQVSLDAKRTAVLNRTGQVDDDELHRRLALALALTRGPQLSTEEDEIRYLRSWDTKRFSLRRLATLYKTSIRHITNVTREDDNDGKEGSKQKQAH